jgi:hypothetical protein
MTHAATLRLSGLIVTELMQIDSLAAVTGRLRVPPRWWTPTARSKAVLGIIAGMAFIHSHGLVHRDLHPRHVLLDERYEVRIAGFARTEAVSSGWPRSPGTALLQAPEKSLGDDYTDNVDVFSFGLTLYLMWAKPTKLDDSLNTQIDGIGPMSAAARWERDAAIPDFYWEVITKCWQATPERRPSFAALLHWWAVDRRWVLPGTDLTALAEYERRVLSGIAAPESVDRTPVPTRSSTSAASPPSRTFRFQCQGRNFALASTTGVLSSLRAELAKRATAPFIVESDGARIADDGRLDPSLVYRVLLFSEQLTVRLETPAAGAAPPFERVCVPAKVKKLTPRQLSQLAGLPESVAFQAFHQNRELRGALDVTRLGADRTVVLRHHFAAPVSYSFIAASSQSAALTISGHGRVAAVKERLLAALHFPAVLPSALALSFWGRDLRNEDDILSYGVPGVATFACDLRPLGSIAVEQNGATAVYRSGAASTAAELSLVIASALGVSPDFAATASGSASSTSVSGSERRYATASAWPRRTARRSGVRPRWPDRVFTSARGSRVSA